MYIMLNPLRQHNLSGLSTTGSNYSMVIVSIMLPHLVYTKSTMAPLCVVSVKFNDLKKKKILFLLFSNALTVSVKNNCLHHRRLSAFQGEIKQVDSQSVTLVAKTQTQHTNRVFVTSAANENNKAFSPARKFLNHQAKQIPVFLPRPNLIR